jgi:hypothetical protein
MSNLPTPVDPRSLDTVTGGTTAQASASSRCAGSDPLLQTLTSLSSTLQNLGNNHSSGGLTSTELLMFGLLMSQRSSVNVFVRRPFW